MAQTVADVIGADYPLAPAFVTVVLPLEVPDAV